MAPSAIRALAQAIMVFLRFKLASLAVAIIICTILQPVWGDDYLLAVKQGVEVALSVSHRPRSPMAPLTSRQDYKFFLLLLPKEIVEAFTNLTSVAFSAIRSDLLPSLQDFFPWLLHGVQARFEDYSFIENILKGETNAYVAKILTIAMVLLVFLEQYSSLVALTKLCIVLATTLWSLVDYLLRLVSRLLDSGFPLMAAICTSPVVLVLLALRHIGLAAPRPDA